MPTPSPVVAAWTALRHRAGESNTAWRTAYCSASSRSWCPPTRRPHGPGRRDSYAGVAAPEPRTTSGVPIPGTPWTRPWCAWSAAMAVAVRLGHPSPVRETAPCRARPPGPRPGPQPCS